jgi:hypothetical protein
MGLRSRPSRHHFNPTTRKGGCPCLKTVTFLTGAKSDFSKWRRHKKAAYLLRGLEHQSLLRAQDKHANELVPSTITTVEHIMPKSPGDGWKKETAADPELHSECLNRLGNLCLLADANRALGNKAFAQKRLSYAASKLRTTNSVAKYEAWGRATIEERQGHLAKLAGSEWRFP